MLKRRPLCLIKKVINPTFEFLLLFLYTKSNICFIFTFFFKFRGRFYLLLTSTCLVLIFSLASDHSISKYCIHKQFIFLKNQVFVLAQPLVKPYKIGDRPVRKQKVITQRNGYSRWHLLHPANKNIKRVDRRIIFTLLTRPKEKMLRHRLENYLHHTPPEK